MLHQQGVRCLPCLLTPAPPRRERKREMPAHGSQMPSLRDEELHLRKFNQLMCIV